MRLLVCQPNCKTMNSGCYETGTFIQFIHCLAVISIPPFCKIRANKVISYDTCVRQPKKTHGQHSLVHCVHFNHTLEFLTFAKCNNSKIDVVMCTFGNVSQGSCEISRPWER